MGCSQSKSTEVVENQAPASHQSAPPASGKSVPVSAPASNVSNVASAQPEAEAQPAEAAATGKFVISGVSITEDGVVYYVIENAERGLSTKKRYNDFKELYQHLENPQALPELPPANIKTLLRGKHSQKLMKEREERFTEILNAIENNPAAAGSEAFSQFLA
ncbi:TPA: hypothetical protein N0F65_000749 [Lagenidium giganteum]|uniref:PX domain-containing protein n=1 Tax=Lagenidium giganteum TaxID=4803 RepID=A0AAV2ZG62_9STRA|nr:TPA: hypothetical protein N0F65_000749 [Lagenidium giganteum]